MPAPGTLTKIEPLHAPLKPPRGSRQAGQTPDGRQIWERDVPRSRAVPDIDPATGHQKYRRAATTGEPLYGINKPERYTQHQVFTLESQGNNNVEMIPYCPPTPEELAADDRARKIAAMQPVLAATLVDAGLTPEDLVARLSQAVAPSPVAVVEPEQVVVSVSDQAPPAEVFPQDKGGAVWLLSDGNKVRGEVKAREAQDAINKAKADAAATPEE